MPISTCHGLLPPFPITVKTAPLVSISLARLESKDEDESDKFFDACKTLGFFYLNMEGSALGEKLVDGAERLHRVQKAFTQLPYEEKELYAREKIDAFFGYRHGDLDKLDEHGHPLRNETYNVGAYQA